MAIYMRDILLSVENLDISFDPDQSLKTVDNVSFTIGNEDVLGIVGESGCGKTLSALSIMRLLPANAFFSGRAFFKGDDLFVKKEDELRSIRGRDISMVFQEPMTALNPVFTVGYQVAEVLVTHKKVSKKQALDMAVELLRTVGIPSPEIRIKEYPHQMSGGMRQRIMIAMAIACNPSLLIADEPTTALDVTIQAQILELLDGLKKSSGMSLLLITHDLGIVAEWVQRVEIMYAGRVVEEARVSEIFSNPRHPYTIGLLGSLPGEKGKRLNPIPGQVPVIAKLPKGCKFATRCGYVIKECHEKEPGLVPTGSAGHNSRCIRAMEL